ncbi:DUF2946 domain-containing protein [Kosakonia cowanii]|uniref:DUF2946 domain-containing protein n=1 Tax=Kosakonia cowanii TaxID=208223 RepID=UPI004062DC88
MYAAWLYRLRFLKRHLLMLLIALGWLLIQSQVAIASHACTLPVPGEAMMQQHMHHLAMGDDAPPHRMKGVLCEKHCVPDLVQQEGHHPSLAALPATLTLAIAEPVFTAITSSGWTLTPPAAGPPATLRFCRFRE